MQGWTEEQVLVLVKGCNTEPAVCFVGWFKSQESQVAEVQMGLDKTG